MNTTPTPRVTPVLYVIMFLLILNLAGTSWLILRKSGGAGEVGGGEKALPSTLGKEKRENLFQEFVKHWNAEDPQSLYEMLDRYAQVQFPKTDAVKQIAHLQETLGTIGDGVYSHHVYKGYENGRDWFELHYNIRFEEVGRTGQLRLDMFHKDEKDGMTGFNLGYE